MELYHLTRKKNIPGIISEGIKPMLGENALKEHERKRRVWLCDGEGLRHWSRVMDMCYALSVSVPGANKDTVCGKARYWTDEAIPPEDITGCRCLYGNTEEAED